jgi:hypothetical protein
MVRCRTHSEHTNKRRDKEGKLNEFTYLNFYGCACSSRRQGEREGKKRGKRERKGEREEKGRRGRERGEREREREREREGREKKEGGGEEREKGPHSPFIR